MAVGSSSPSVHSMGNSSTLRGYSDFFASGFRAVSTGVRRRPTSLYSSTSDSSDTEDDYAPPTHPGTFNLPSVFRSRLQRRQRRPVSMMISRSAQRSTEDAADRRLSLASFSSRLRDRIPFASGDEPPATARSDPQSSPGKRTKRRSFLNVLRHSNADSRARGSWISTGGPSTPSAPNGESCASIDPFASSPESKSFFIDLSSDGSSIDGPVNLKRESFLSMTNTTTSNSSPSISLIHYSPRRERPVSMHTVSLPSRSRRSSFQCRGQSSEKAEQWIPEEEDADVLNLSDDCEARDDAAQIDWRQFHNDLLSVDEA